MAIFSHHSPTNFANRIQDWDACGPGVCRDNGRGWVDVGALCLSSWQRESVGVHDVPSDDVHQTRTSTRPPPFPASTHCPYRTRTHPFPSLLVVNIHQAYFVSRSISALVAFALDRLFAKKWPYIAIPTVSKVAIKFGLQFFSEGHKIFIFALFGSVTVFVDIGFFCNVLQLIFEWAAFKQIPKMVMGI